MNDGDQPRSNKLRVLGLITAIGAVVGTLIFGSMRSVEAECSLCVEFNGQRQCRTGLGPTEDEARDAAQRAACAVMTSGMADTINCSRVPPQEMQCSTGG